MDLSYCASKLIELVHMPNHIVGLLDAQYASSASNSAKTAGVTEKHDIQNLMIQYRDIGAQRLGASIPLLVDKVSRA